MTAPTSDDDLIIDVELDEDELRALKDIAAESGVSTEDLILKAVVGALEARRAKPIQHHQAEDKTQQ